LGTGEAIISLIVRQCLWHKNKNRTSSVEVGKWAKGGRRAEAMGPWRRGLSITAAINVVQQPATVTLPGKECLIIINQHRLDLFRVGRFKGQKNFFSAFSYQLQGPL
jgi:hypothetical protein